MEKKYTLNYNILVYTLLLFFCAQASFAQLPAFTLSVTKTDEFCTGNGTLSFTTSGTTAGSSIFYSVFLVPNLTDPLAVVTTPTLGGLASGSYHVVATQSLGAQSNTAAYDIQISDIRTPLAYNVVGQPINCLTGKITVNVTQGTAATYEISAGPVIVPPQTSNVFNNLPIGQYTIKVTDICNDVLVRDFTLVYVFDPNYLQISNNAVQFCGMVDCDTKTAGYTIGVPLPPTPGSSILYPFEVELTVFPPNGGTPIVLHQTVNSGNPFEEEILFDVPYYNVPGYLSTIKITDPCGNVIERSGISLTGTKSLELGSQPPSVCPKLLSISTCNMVPPLTVQFLTSPPGFNPSTFNPGGLGPFNSNFIVYSTTPLNELPSGFYDVKITDSCGSTLQDDITIKDSKTDHKVEMPGFFDGCVFNNILHVPDQGVPIVTAIFTEAPPGYAPMIPYDVTSLIDSSGHLVTSLTVPGFYTITGVNVCGDPYEFDIEIKPPFIKPYILGENPMGCTNFLGTITVGYQTGLVFPGSLEQYVEGPAMVNVTIVQAPPEFTELLPYDASAFIQHSGVFPDLVTKAVIPNLPVGDYVLNFTDACGNAYGPLEVNIPVQLFYGPLDVSVLEGCELGHGSVQLKLPIDANTSLMMAVITAAPPTFPHPLPYNITMNISGSAVYMNSLPDGNYTFYTKDYCGVEHKNDVTIETHFYESTADFEGHCGSFNLFIHHPPNPPGAPVYYVLQKWNPTLNVWTHPITGFVFQPGTYPNSANSYILGDSNYNITSQGHFRILKLTFMYSNGNDALIPCINTLREFDFLGTLKIISAYKISCVSGNSQVLIVAGDTDPLHYFITEKDGEPYAVDNHESNVFNNLTPGIYNFLVKDLCGNEVNRLFDVTALVEPVVIPSTLCDGMEGQISIQPFSFLSYQWWKADDPTDILSTTNELHFTPFSMTTTPGIYYVRVYSQSTLSCLDITIPYVIADASNPQAGDDGQLTICDRASINLNNLLNGTHDANGIWSEVTSSGMLTGSVWLPQGPNVPPGVYQFKYTVNGFCGLFDEALINITVTGAPSVPVLSVDEVFCMGSALHFHVEPIPNATFEWTGPNAFFSTEQNPIIENSTIENNGTYIVKAMANGCESTASIELNLQPAPDFRLVGACVNGVYTVSVTAINNSFDTEDATYIWTGPENFTSTENPIRISGKSPGSYAVAVTTENGCLMNDSLQVVTTVCSIPNVITPNDDNNNDDFDLSAFDVRRIEIYSRWGRLVYSQNSYTNQWHGQNSHNEELPDSTYYYILYLGSGEEKQGWVFKTTWP